MLDSLINLLMLSLIVYRLAHMITREDGPFGLAIKFRGFIAVRMGDDSFVTQGFFCPLCVGFWIASVVAYGMYHGQGFVVVLQWLAIAGLSAFMERISK